MNRNIDLNEILEKHRRWLSKSSGWSEKDRAILCRADLSYADMSDMDLSGGDLSGANLFGADLSRSNLTGCDMTSAVLSKANLTGASLRRATLLNANLYRANVSGANFYGANLFEANLSDVNIADAVNFPYVPFTCPDTGSFIGWKKAISADKTEVIVKLEIPEDAKRSSATGRKCRCNKAKVLSIRDIDDTKDFTVAYGSHDDTYVYTAGETVVVGDFDTDRWNECSSGIHFYITRPEAVNYR